MTCWLGLALLSSALGTDLTGTITTAADGTPVPDALVVAYDQRLNYATEVTDADGHFAFTSLADNPYRLRVVPPVGVNLAEEWGDDTLHVCQATRFDTGAASLPAVTIALDEGAVLSGTLVDEGGVVVPGAQVTARTVLATALAQSRMGTTDANGDFTVPGIAADDGETGTVVLEVLLDGWPKQYLPGTYRKDEGQAHTVAPGQAVSLGAIALLPGVGVGGAVTGPDGPVAAGEANAYSPSQIADALIVAGRYEIWGLPPGQVLTWASADGLATTYLPDVDRPGERVSVDTEGLFVDDLDLDLPTESVLRGRLLGDGDLSGASVLAYNSDRTVGIGAVAEADGSFRVDRLHGGCYTLFVHVTDEGFVSDFLLDEGGAERELCIAAGAESEVFDIPLVAGASIYGTVTDRYDGTPVYGAKVTADGERSGTSASVRTDHAGNYALVGLTAEPWTVSVAYDYYCEEDPDWAVVYFPDVINPVLGGVVDLAVGEARQWDVSLPPDGDHDDMDDEWERTHGLDPDRDDGAEDPDLDGFTNLEEYLLGTDPRDAAGADPRCGCDGDRAAFFGILCLPLWTARRRRVYAPVVRTNV